MDDLDYRGLPESSLDDELAVDLPYRDLVIKHLTDMDAGGGTPGEEDPRLELGLIELRAAARTAAAFAARHGEPEPSDERLKATAVDIILHGLRRDIGARYGGWFPRMGKVRNTDVVGGLPHIGSNWEYPKIAPDGRFALPPATSPAGRDMTVDVIDGRMYPHPELTDRWDGPGPAGDVPEEPYPWLLGHAAFVCGRLLHRAPGARLLVRGVLKDDLPRATVWDVAKAMADALDDGVTVLNLSLGCYTADGQPPFVLNRAVEVLTGRGVAVVAAAGNHGRKGSPTGIAPNAPIFPAACPGAVAVGAFTKNLEPAPFSPRAPWIALGAPGHEVPSTYLIGKVEFGVQLPGLPPKPDDMTYNGLAIWSGTSFATATVSGELARIMSASGKSAPEAVAQLRDTNPADNDGIGRYT